MSRAYKQIVREVNESSFLPEEPASRVRVRRSVDLSTTKGRWSSRDYLEGVETGLLTVLAIALAIGAIVTTAWIVGFSQ